MKVYVITSGEYSAYGIRAVALSREKAELICAMLNSTERDYGDVATIEEYDQTKFNVMLMRMLVYVMRLRLITKH